MLFSPLLVFLNLPRLKLSLSPLHRVLTDVSGLFRVILYLHSLVVSPGFIRGCAQTPRARRTSIFCYYICVVWRELSHFRQFSHVPNFCSNRICVSPLCACSLWSARDGWRATIYAYFLISVLYYWLIHCLPQSGLQPQPNNVTGFFTFVSRLNKIFMTCSTLIDYTTNQIYRAVGHGGEASGKNDIDLIFT